jgi:hypothetical protein
MRSARALIQSWDKEGLYSGNWLVVVAFPQMTRLLESHNPDRVQVLKHMMAVGGKPVSLLGLTDGKGGRGTCSVLFRFNENYYAEQWACEYMGEVARIIHNAFNKITAPPPEDPNDWIIPIGTGAFSDTNRHERNQTWARQKADVIAKFLQTRRKTSVTQHTTGRSTCSKRWSNSGATKLSGVAPSNKVMELVPPTTPAIRAAGDLLEELRIAADGKYEACLIIGFERTTRLIRGSNNCTGDRYKHLKKALQDGGDVVGVVTITCNQIKGKQCFRTSGRLVQEHVGQGWAARYLDAVRSSFMESNPVGMTIGMKEFLEAN